MIVRSCRASDADAIWGILEPVIRAGETYALPRDWSRSDALDYWHSRGEDVGVVVGTYYLHANQRGGGAHVANCGYVTDYRASGRGVARAMCLHSLELARVRGFRAMQFNFVVATNARAVALWRRLGFDIVGTLPAAFQHPRQGLVDAYVMYRML
jgi:ribosomal protein S18 acetylase RimI-like enzyme